ncbi:hypothetical protein DFH94DRAFT_489036 [Russula ochroleuca]|uniref:Uncharacterized protein n=1 Tax=Russula ochroleuca TaxID=152965 RepID=A0A9P5T959_9AGAM|nr:hypothetical protein DFH94DRAFT_489036 [Russula ochroleuca]
MSIVESRRITVKQPFAKLPALLDLPPIGHTGSRASTVSSFRGRLRSEGCLVTKSIKYTNQLAHWVNAVRGNSDESKHLKKRVEDILSEDLRIIFYEGFSLNDPCNLAYCKSNLFHPRRI